MQKAGGYKYLYEKFLLFFSRSWCLTSSRSRGGRGFDNEKKMMMQPTLSVGRSVGRQEAALLVMHHTHTLAQGCEFGGFGTGLLSSIYFRSDSCEHSAPGISSEALLDCGKLDSKGSGT